MVSFVQQVEGAKDVGIGDQRVFEQDSRGQAYAIRQAGESFANLAEDTRSFIGAKKGIEAVSKAQSQFDKEVSEIDELEKLSAIAEPTTDELKRKVTLLEKGVRQGKVSRENARLRVADLVTQSIQENPMFADKIRESAGNLLGFDPASEGVQQFFSAFDTRDELEYAAAQAAKGSGVSTYDKEADALFRAGVFGSKEEALQHVMKTKMTEDKQNAAIRQKNLDKAPELSTYDEGVQILMRDQKMSEAAARSLMSQAYALNKRKESLKAQFEMDEMSEDKYLGQAAMEDTLSAQSQTMQAALLLKANGKEVNATTLQQALDLQKQNWVSSMMEDLNNSGKLTPQSITKINSTADLMYGNVAKMFDNMDSSFITKDNLERLTIAQQKYASEIMPGAVFIHNNFGSAALNSLIDASTAIGTNPEKMKLFLSINPGMEPLLKIFNNSPQDFNSIVLDATTRLADPNAKLNQPNDGAAIDYFLYNSRKLPPEETSKVANSLIDKGMPTKATSFLLQRGASAVTPQDKTFIKQQWDIAKTVIPEQIVQDIIKDSKTRGNKLKVKVVDGKLDIDGNLFETLTPLEYTIGTVGTDAASMSMSGAVDIADKINKINMYLNSFDKGWGSVYKEADKNRTAEQLKNLINSSLEDPVTNDNTD